MSAIVIVCWMIQKIDKMVTLRVRKFVRTIAEGTIMIYVMHFAMLNPFYHLFLGFLGLSLDSPLMPVLQILESVFILLAFIPVIVIVKKRCPLLLGK